jgi:hypothetical protein
MSEPEGFLSRWARRKRAAAELRETTRETTREDTQASAREATLEAEMDEAIAASATRAPPAAEAPAAPGPEAQPPVDLSADLANLPPIESITAATDIRPFLAPGVPAELTRAALRRAWLADPQIRDFVGIAENQWDFTDPSAIPGFGPIGPLDDVRRMVAALVGERSDTQAPPAGAAVSHPPDMTAGSQPAAPPPAAATTGEAAGLENERPARAAAEDMPRNTDDSDAAVQKDDNDAPRETGRIRRGHGGALPT